MKKLVITISVGLVSAALLVLLFSLSQVIAQGGTDAYFTSFNPGDMMGTGGCTVTTKYYAECVWNAPAGNWVKFGDGTSAPRLMMTSTGVISSATILVGGPNPPPGSYSNPDDNPSTQMVFPTAIYHDFPENEPYTFTCALEGACYTEYLRFYKWVKVNGDPPTTFRWSVSIIAINGVPIEEEEPPTGPCINDDENLLSPVSWTDINTPTWISGTGGVLLDYDDGIQQTLSLSDTGYYHLEITATLPISFPADRSGVRMCLGEGCAIASPISTGTAATFNVLQGGNYDLSIVNLSSSRIWPTNTITLSYVCLNHTANPCIVLDPDMDNIRLPEFAGEQGWATVYDGVRAQPDGAMLGCNQSVDQWVYLDVGTYTMTLEAQSDFIIIHGAMGLTTDISGALTIRIGHEDDPSNEYSIYHVPIHHVDSDELGQDIHNRVYTTTFEIPEPGNYVISLLNLGCKRSSLEFTDGRVWVDYVCLGEDGTLSSSRLGQCTTLIDAPFQEYEARHWGRIGDVSWTPGYMSLGPWAAITQTVDISATPPITVLVAHVVARAQPGAQLRISVGEISHTFTISEALSSEFHLYRAELYTLTLPAVYQLEALSDTVEIDFTCLYLPGEEPDGDWYNGADGDTECIEPLPFQWEGLSLASVQAVLKYIWEWIVYLVCLMVLWLRRIWMAIGNMIHDWVIDLGLDRFWLGFRLWLRELWQGPYDWLQLIWYVLNLVLDLAGRFFAMIGRGFGAVFSLFGLILVGLRFLGALLGAFWAAVQEPCDPLSIVVPVPIVQGFLLALEVIEELTIIQYIEWLVIGLMGVSMVVWTVGQFKSFGGGE